MHPFEIAEHGLQERRLFYARNIEISIKSAKYYLKKGRRLIGMKKPRKYIKKFKKRNRKIIKKLRRLIFPDTLTPLCRM
jgi:hypothetical protein